MKHFYDRKNIMDPRKLKLNLVGYETKLHGSMKMELFW